MRSLLRADVVAGVVFFVFLAVALYVGDPTTRELLHGNPRPYVERWMTGPHPAPTSSPGEDKGCPCTNALDGGVRP